MKKLFIVLFIFTATAVFAQQKYALVIGNGQYTNFGSLRNAVNDANDMTAALQGLGFTVDKVIDGNRVQMVEGITRLKNRLSGSKSSYGFFFYAGHAVQLNGVNYLIPAKADIPNANYLPDASISVQTMLAELNDAGNALNIVVLDACRDFPAAWSRTANRGLTVVANQPADSIIVYATSAGSTAADGTGRNGLFTSQLLKNLKTPGLEVNEVFRLTGLDVSRASNRQQTPAIYNQFFETAYLGSRPQPAAPPPTPPPAVFESGEAVIATGSLEISTVTAGTVRISGGAVNQSRDIPAWGSLPIEKINAGTYRVAMRYTDGKTEERTVEVERSQRAKVEFSYRPPVQPTPTPTPAPTPAPAPAVQPAAPPQRPVVNEMIRINGGTFQMGSNSGDSDEKPVHTVTISSFYMGKYEVTQKEWTAVIGNNPSNFKGDNLPVESVTWYDAVEYCNKLSQKEGLTPAYTISGRTPATGYPITSATVTWNRNANGYRLPTEAEWEYAAKGGNGSPGNYTYAGSNTVDEVAWHTGNSGSRTHEVGTKKPNGLGLYDMSGNVREWCWDWFGTYASGAQTAPQGASSGSYRVLRGGNWYHSVEHVRSAYRFNRGPDYRSYNIGFRLVRP